MIILDSVSKIYDTDLLKSKNLALDNMNFELKKNTITGFLGANGAGKTTCLKIILDFVRPSSGKVNYANELGGSIQSALKNIGYLPERPYFYSHLTGREFLTYMGKLSGLKNNFIKEQINFWSSKLVIDHALDRKLHFYSKGMLQRIGFLSSIIHGPKLLILDEPASGLDPLGRKELKDAIRTVHNMGTTVFFSSHIVSDVQEVCDQLIFINKGKLVYQGSVHEIITKNSTQEYSINYLKNNVLESVYSSTQTLNDHLKQIMSASYTVVSVEPKVLTLEDIIYKSQEII